MWFECLHCEHILPLYEMDSESARFSPDDEWICADCAWDLLYGRDLEIYDEDYDPEDEEEER